MRLSLPIALTCLSMALPAAAQDIAAEYAAAFAAFTLPGYAGRDPEAALAAIEASLPGLQGNWVRADLLSDDTAVLDPAMLANACARHYEQLVHSSPHGFEMRRTNRDGKVLLRVQYDFVGLNFFDRSYDEAEWLAYLGFDADQMAHASAYYGQPRGEVILFVPGPNTMVFQETRGLTEIYTRCP